MSQVIPIPKLGVGIVTLASYIQNFRAMIADHKILLATVPIGSVFEVAVELEREANKIFDSWLIQTGQKWLMPANPKYHKFFPDERKELARDWPPPPIYFMKSIAPALALPQFPQERVRINDPTDPNGRKRSIRVHFGEEPER